MTNSEGPGTNAESRGAASAESAEVDRLRDAVHTLEAEVCRLRADGAAQADLLHVTRGLLHAAREDRNSLWTLATSLQQSCAALQQELERLRAEEGAQLRAENADLRQHAANLEHALESLREHVRLVEADRDAMRANTQAER